MHDKYTNTISTKASALPQLRSTDATPSKNVTI